MPPFRRNARGVAFAFHGTPTCNASEIRRDGLRPDEDGRVFVARAPALALLYGYLGAIDEDKPRVAVVQVAIDDVRQLRRDPEANAEYDPNMANVASAPRELEHQVFGRPGRPQPPRDRAYFQAVERLMATAHHAEQSFYKEGRFHPSAILAIYLVDCEE